MSTTHKSLAVLCALAISATPMLASLSDVQATVAGVNNTVVTVAVHNSGLQTEVARVQMTVQLDDGTTQVLTSAKFGVAGGATVSVSVSAAGQVVSISDGPEPISTN